MAFGAFVEFLPGKQGLLHISEVSWKRLDSLEGVLKEGDKVKIKLVGTDPKTGKLRLSRKVLMPKPEGYVEPEKRERSDRPERGERRDGDRRDRGGDRGDRRGGDRGDRREGGDRRDRGDRPPREPRNENQGGEQQPQQNAAANNEANDVSDADLAL
jgi:polyribonucleotide nucleotidyltransferase